MGIGLCIWEYHTRDTGYDLLRASSSASGDLTHARDRAYDSLRALGSASGDITHDTVGTICYWHWVLRPVKSHTRQGVRFVTDVGSYILWYGLRKSIVYDLLLALGSASFDITHETTGTICHGHWDLLLVISHTGQGVQYVSGIGLCIL